VEDPVTVNSVEFVPFAFTPRLLEASDMPRLEDPVADKETVPEKNPRLVSLIVDAMGEPVLATRDAGFAETEKSLTLSRTKICFEYAPLVALTVSVKIPPEAAVTMALMNRLEPEESVMVVWLRLTLGPVGDVVVEKLIVPVKPLRLEMVRVALADVPAVKVSVDGLAVRLKSIMVSWTVMGDTRVSSVNVLLSWVTYVP